MKYSPKHKLYKASNLTYNPITQESTSYDHWKFTKIINGYLVFNNYRYSNTTTKHQYKVRQKLRELDIRIDFIVDTEMTLDNGYWLTNAIARLENNIEINKTALENPRSNRIKNAERASDIAKWKSEIEELHVRFGVLRPGLRMVK